MTTQFLSLGLYHGQKMFWKEDNYDLNRYQGTHNVGVSNNVSTLAATD